MSSAVNKSSKRFVPKLGSRGSSIRAPVRRNTRTSFSTPVRGDSTSIPSSAADLDATDAEKEAQSPEVSFSRAEALGLTIADALSAPSSAIDDADDFGHVAPGSITEADLASESESPLSSSRPSVSFDTSAGSRDKRRVSVPKQSTSYPSPSTVPGAAAGGISQPEQSTIYENGESSGLSLRSVDAQTIEEATSNDALPEAAEGEAQALPPTRPSTETGVRFKQTKLSGSRGSANARQPISAQPVRLTTLSAPRKAPSVVKRLAPLSSRQGSVGSNRRASSNTVSAVNTLETRPEAPPGCQIIEPEDLRDLRRQERRRREAWESEQVKLMRDMFIKKEQKRLMDEESYDETSSMRAAHEIAGTMTFNALKQAVMSELKEHRESTEKHNSVAGATESVGSETQLSADALGASPPLKQLINVEKFKMSDLCKDIPIGVPNEKYDDYENARVQRRRDRLLLLRAKNWKRNALKREPSESEKALLETVYAKFRNERLARSDKIKEESERKLKSLDDTVRAGPSAAPTLEIGQDGQIRIEHTQVDRHQNNRSNQVDTAQNKVEVDETQKTINSYSFSTKERPERWSKEETQKFYEALSAWGTDFNLIAHLFPTRSRHQIKTKFKYEERRHSIKVQMYLLNRRKANVNSYAEVSDQQIEDVKDIEEALERVRDEHEERMKLEQMAREQARVEDNQKLEHETPKRRARDQSLPTPKRERVR